MKKIIVAYWFHSVRIDQTDLEYSHGQEFEYSEEKKMEIINNILSKGYAIMIRANQGDNGEYLNIWISKYSFGQR